MTAKVERISGNTVIATAYRVNPTKANPQGVPFTAGKLEVVDSVDLSVTETITHTFVSTHHYWALANTLVPTNDSVIPFFRVNGDSGASDYGWVVIRTNLKNDADGLDSEIQLVGILPAGSAANESCGPWRIDFGDMGDSLYKKISWSGGYISDGAFEIYTLGHGRRLSTDAITSITLGVSGGWESGRLTLYRAPMS